MRTNSILRKVHQSLMPKRKKGKPANPAFIRGAARALAGQRKAKTFRNPSNGIGVGF